MDGVAVAERVSALDLGFIWLRSPSSLRCNPNFPNSSFDRVYAAYDGFFIVLSFFWGWAVDGDMPERFDVIGGALSLAGVLIIIYCPR